MQTNEVAAFDQWLSRGLAEMYGATLKEPVPEEMLRLLDSASPEG